MSNSSLQAVLSGINEIEKQTQSKDHELSNSDRLNLYSRAEIARMDFEEICSLNSIQDSLVQEIVKKIGDIQLRLNLKIKNSDGSLSSAIFAVYRFFLFITALIISGTIGSLLLMMCQVIDAMLNIKLWSTCERMRQFIATSILILVGIHVEVQGSLGAVEKLKCVILIFSHASNFDGFLICSTWPIRLLAFAKKELFMVPFFSWISFAMGGIPVDRQNRGRAVRTLKRVVDSARHSNVGFVISPEGTRSATGQLQQFKKGAFYMWEDLRSPVMPVIFFGGYELWPGKNWINTPGYIIVRYLDPIYPDESISREKMLATVRRRMLESFMTYPPNAAASLSLTDQIFTFYYQLIYLTFLSGISYLLQLWIHALNLSAITFSMYALTVSIVFTIVLYVAHVYKDS